MSVPSVLPFCLRTLVFMNEARPCQRGPQQPAHAVDCDVTACVIGADADHVSRGSTALTNAGTVARDGGESVGEGN